MCISSSFSMHDPPTKVDWDGPTVAAQQRRPATPRSGKAPTRFSWRRTKAANSSRFERWKRENDAPRLRSHVSDLESLRLELSERGPGGTTPGTRHTLHIIVSNAAALFQIPCSDPECQGGGHDITEAVLRGLMAHLDSTTGDDVCIGNVGTTQCGRRLRY